MEELAGAPDSSGEGASNRQPVNPGAGNQPSPQRPSSPCPPARSGPRTVLPAAGTSEQAPETQNWPAFFTPAAAAAASWTATLAAGSRGHHLAAHVTPADSTNAALEGRWCSQSFRGGKRLGSSSRHQCHSSHSHTGRHLRAFIREGGAQRPSFPGQSFCSLSTRYKWKWFVPIQRGRAGRTEHAQRPRA